MFRRFQSEDEAEILVIEAAIFRSAWIFSHQADNPRREFVRVVLNQGHEPFCQHGGPLPPQIFNGSFEAS